MRYTFIAILCLLTLLMPVSALGFQYSAIKSKTLAAKIKGPCAFVHFWAAWCEICVTELPTLLPRLMQRKNISLVVVDLSQNLAQAKFSLPWLKKIAPTSETYHKGNRPSRELVNIVDTQWQGGLPYSALFSKGKRVIDWKGSANFNEFDRSIVRHCDTNNY